MSNWPGLPQQDDYGFNNAFGQNSLSQVALRSTQQNYQTAYTLAQIPFPRLQATAAAATEYSAEGYQSQAYSQRQPRQPQQRSVNENLAYSNQWYGGGSDGGRRSAASARNDNLTNSATMNQTSTSNSGTGVAGEASSNRVYDTTGFENLIYASAAVGYATEPAAERLRNQDTLNAGSHYGGRTLPTAADTPIQYTQTYTQPFTTSTNSPQYNYTPQIVRPTSTDSSTSQSTTYSQRQTPIVSQQTLQTNIPTASPTNTPYRAQQTSGYGTQPAQSTSTQPSNGYAQCQTPTITSRMNQTTNFNKVAQAARAYAQSQGHYGNTQNQTSSIVNPAIPQRQTIAAPNRSASQASSQRQASAASGQRHMTATSHQRSPSTNSKPARSSPVTHQRQVSTAAPSSSTIMEAHLNTASPLYRYSNPIVQPVLAMKSNLSQQSTNFNPQQPQVSNQQPPQSEGYANTPQIFMNQQPQQSLSASNQTRNPRSLLSPTEASAQAYQSRNAGPSRQEDNQEAHMQTVIDPRDLDLRPRPSPFAILEAVKLMREVEEREAAAAAATAVTKEQAENMSAETSTQKLQNSNAAESNDTLTAPSNNNAQEASNTTDRLNLGPAHPPASPQNSRSRRQAQRPAASPASQSKPAPSNPSQTPEPKRNRVVWPESKKRPLAAAAIEVLISFPENAGKTITKEQIHAMLDEGPTYIEFCERIEGMMFKLDRARLASTLLSAVASETAAAQPTLQANSKSKASTSRNNQNLLRHPTSSASRGGQPLVDPQISGRQTHHNQNIGPGAIVSLAEPAIGPDGQNQIQWRPLGDSDNNGAENISISEEATKKRRPHRKSAPVLGPDGLPTPPRPRGRPRRDGLPPIPRKSMPAMGTREDTPSATKPHPLSAFAYQASSSMRSPPLLNIDNPRSPFSNRSDSLEPLADDRRARHTQTLKGRWDSMNDKPKNFPYPDTDSPPSQDSRDDIENRLLAALEDEGHHYQGQTRDFQIGETSAPSSSNKRNVTAKATQVAQRNKSNNSQQQQQEKLPQPLSKEMAARKRDFAELIDLTLEDSDTADAPGPHKFPRVENATNRYNENLNYGVPNEPSTILPNLHGHPFPPTHHQINGEELIPSGFQRQQQHDLIGTSSPHISSRNSPNPYEHFDDLCKPIVKNLALRKSEYNPKTIARDVLIAVGRHPTQRAINAHLEILKKKFPKQVNTRSDLSTFRWDIVDPGGLPYGSANMPPTEEEKSQKSVNKIQTAFPSSSTPYRPLHTASSEVSSGFKRPTNTAAPEVSSAFKRPVNTTPARPSHLRHEASGPSEIASASPRRGRPPKDRSGESSKGPGSLHESKGPSSQHEDSTSNPTPKKRGRPFKSAESALKAAVKQQRLSTGELQPGRRGRPPKALIEPTKLVDPKYISFDCEWRGCKAELQNLETLRQHIFTVHDHTQPDGGISCQWINCGKDEVITDPETMEPRTVHHDLTLHNIEKFKKHMEKKHLPDYAWNLGDGPKGSDLDGNESDVSYLSDANGKQVTPSIKDQEIVLEHRNRSDSLTIAVNKNGEPRKRVGRPPKNKIIGSENAEVGASRDSSVAAGSTST